MDPVERYRVDLGQRLADVAAQFPRKGAAAAAAGVTLEQFNKWLAGTVKVPAEGLYRLAMASGTDFSWLCTGGEIDQVKGSSRKSKVLDPDVMETVLKAMVSVTSSGDVICASPEKFAELAIVLHDYVSGQRGSGAPVDLCGAMGKIIRLASR